MNNAINFELVPLLLEFSCFKQDINSKNNNYYDLEANKQSILDGYK